MNSIRLKYVARLGYGDSLPSDVIDSDSVPVYGSNGPYAKTNKPNALAPCIIIGRKGSYGKINWSGTACFASDTTFFIDRSLSSQNLRWLFYVLHPLDLHEGSGEAAVPGINREAIYEKRVLLPNAEKQARIATYLDAQTTEIDELIAEKERMLDLLEEQRAAVVTHAVTRGLDHNVPLKPSGLEWLGEIPHHWNCRRLRFLLKRIDQGWSPECYNFPAEEGCWGVLKTGCVNGGVFRENENKAIPPDLEPPEGIVVRVGDVLMSRASGSVHLIGSVARVMKKPESELLLSDKTFRLVIKSELIDPDFLVASMGSAVLRFQIKAFISGAEGLANNIARTDIDELLIPLAPLEEQKAITVYLKSEGTQISELVESLNSSIALLKERRAALITAAVTGQIPIEEMHL